MLRISAELDRRDRDEPLPLYPHRALVMVSKPNLRATELERICQQDPRLQGLRAAAFHSDVLPYVRDNLLDAFGSLREDRVADAPRMLIVVEMLREGYDNPSISIVGVGRKLSGKGPTFEQFVGRAVRLIEGKPRTVTAAVFWHRVDDCQLSFDQYMNDRVVAMGDAPAEEAEEKE
jgi:superfamily II DNA or RNA helicase